MMSDLFSGEPSTSPGAASHVPLAERLRPKTIDEVIGQQHLLGRGKPLRLAFESGQPHSMIFWGPPGVGKTTLARLMAGAFESDFIALSAVLSGVKEIREAVVRAEMTQKQAAILDSAARLVKPGGRLVYATCSLMPEENEGIVDAFLAAHPQFGRLSAKAVLAAQGITVDLSGDDLHLLPHLHGTDGFYAGVLERAG